ncbi:hypothetical protein CASFOL_024193 [Castilleja foliolosa]|uniref:Hemimethylated DNA-binding domain-containing protein n=1 Tax=Castilleja foliolosa TaxID=1961234 RepID=A0ABD3CPP4_9LAMI
MSRIRLNVVSVGHHPKVVQAFIDPAGKREPVQQVYEEEVFTFAKCFEVSDNDWMSILSRCVIQTNVKVVECVFEELERKEVTGASHLVTMANLFASVGDYSRSEQMRSLMKKRGLNKKPAFSTKKEFSTFVAYDPLFEGNRLHDHVESEVIKLRESRSGSSSKSEAQDMAISVLRLRAELQIAIQSENYSLAAQLRDEISKLKAKSLTASVKAQAYENAQYNFRLGQKVKHKIFGYRAVICGMDPVCGESKSWIDGANVKKLTRGPDQPFYQVLVDVHEDPNLVVAYVPEENLVVTDQQDTDRFDHPYASFLFYGVDAAGDYIPIKQLREKYNQPRHELPYDPNDEQDRKDS